jgi:chemotaxis signal transduction protein
MERAQMDRRGGIELATAERPNDALLAGAQYIIVDLAGASYAVPLGVVHEVEHVPKLAPVPHSRPWIRGVVNLRGSVLTLMDPAALLEVGVWERTPDARMLVVGGDDPLALAVDRLRGMRRLAGEVEASLAANLPGKVAEYSLGVYRDAGTWLIVLDIARLLDDADDTRAARGGESARAPELLVDRKGN